VVKLAVELTDAEADLGKLVQQVGAGAEVLITRNGRPVARLVSVAEAGARDRVPGSAKGLFTVPDDFDAPLDDFRDYM
jgi:prevent-host-death family protein